MCNHEFFFHEITIMIIQQDKMKLIEKQVNLYLAKHNKYIYLILA